MDLPDLPAIAIDLRTWSRLRVWAAAVRDREDVHSGASPAAVGLAATLCNLLDVHKHLQAINLKRSVGLTIAQLVGWLVILGVAGPA